MSQQAAWAWRVECWSQHAASAAAGASRNRLATAPTANSLKRIYVVLHPPVWRKACRRHAANSLGFLEDADLRLRNFRGLGKDPARSHVLQTVELTTNAGVGVRA